MPWVIFKKHRYYEYGVGSNGETYFHKVDAENAANKENENYPYPGYEVVPYVSQEQFLKIKMANPIIRNKVLELVRIIDSYGYIVQENLTETVLKNCSRGGFSYSFEAFLEDRKKYGIHEST